MNNIKPEDILPHELKMVAWEVTRACNLKCAHCRASADRPDDPEALTAEQCLAVIDQIIQTGKPVIILTGGEPLLRDDLCRIAAYATGKGLRVVLGTNGTLLDKKNSRELKEAGVSAAGISLDYPCASMQDQFRGVAGAFQAALGGIQAARDSGLRIQINTTVTQMNVAYLDAMLDLAIEVGATAFHPFLLVPTGRGKELEDTELPPREYERVLNWVYDRQIEYGKRLFIKPTDAPHYQRIISQRRQTGSHLASDSTHNHRLSRGCMAGSGFCFISHSGVIQGCGYFTLPAGKLSDNRFIDIWEKSPLFQDLRDISRLEGKCGGCEYKRVCGGCRARAYETSGNYLAAEPYCAYQPQPNGAADE